MVWTEEGPVPRQVVEVVHDHGDKQVQDLECVCVGGKGGGVSLHLQHCFIVKL